MDGKHSNSMNKEHECLRCDLLIIIFIESNKLLQ